MSDKYAYGAWTVDDCPCPLESAGFGVNENTEEVARQYDYEVQEIISWANMEGTIHQDAAEKAILEARSTFENGTWEQRSEELVKICDHLLEKEFNE